MGVILKKLPIRQQVRTEVFVGHWTECDRLNDFKWRFRFDLVRLHQILNRAGKINKECSTAKSHISLPPLGNEKGAGQSPAPKNVLLLLSPNKTFPTQRGSKAGEYVFTEVKNGFPSKLDYTVLFGNVIIP